MDKVETLERGQQRRYPGLRVRRDGDRVVVNIPAQFRRRNGRFLVLADSAPGAGGNSELEGNQALIGTLARAYRWQEEFESGKYSGLDELARAVRRERSYVGRILRLTSLSPRILEQIMHGNEPNGISLEKLHKELPLSWQKQRDTWLIDD